jgi:NitT/TauT family transport system substrate-binding protein
MKHILPAVLLALAAVLPAHAEDPRPLRIGWVQAMANAPALIAEEKGYFRDEGLNVELKGFGDGPVIQQAVAGGEIDAAYIGAPRSINGRRAVSRRKSSPRSTMVRQR